MLKGAAIRIRFNLLILLTFLTPQLQLIERFPIVFAFRLAFTCDSERCARGLANAVTITIAVRMGRQIQQNIFPYERRKIDNFRPVQFRVQRKRRHLDFVHEFFQTSHATQFYWLHERAICPKRVIRNADVDLVMKRAGATDLFRLQFRDRTGFFAPETRTFGRNLFEMNFHCRKPSEFISRIFL
jgi:hypothetical protein